MDINWGLSLWNFFHHDYSSFYRCEGGLPELQDVLANMNQCGYRGVELWRHWKGEDLFEPDMAKAVCDWCGGLRRSLHTQGVRTIEEHQAQIDGAQRCGAELIVLHPQDICDFENWREYRDDVEPNRPDVSFTREIVAYAAERNVVLALENGALSFLVEAIENVEGLRICLDIGHIYIETVVKTMAECMEGIGSRLAHLHLQDIVSEPEKSLPGAGLDHYTPGTGAIAETEWRHLFRSLEDWRYTGLAIVETRPRNPFLQGAQALRFLQNMQGPESTAEGR